MIPRLCDPAASAQDAYQRARTHGYGPDYDDITAKWMREPQRFTGYLDDHDGRVAEAIYRGAHATDVLPEYLAAVMMTEGLVEFLRIDRQRTPFHEITIHGIADVGAEAVGTEWPTLQHKGYLRKDYDGIRYLKGQDFINEEAEWNQNPTRYPPFEFKSVQDAAEGIGAYLRYTRDVLEADAQRFGVPIAEGELEAWNYIYYNAGPAKGRARLLRHQGKLPDTFRTNTLDTIYNARWVGGTTELARSIGIYQCRQGEKP